METKILKWGNSLGLRIPKSFAEEARVKAGSRVDVTVDDGDLIVRPVRGHTYHLATLLKEINGKNIRGAVEVGPPVGREVW